MNDPHSYPQSGRLPPREQLIMGLHAIREVLFHAPDRLIRVFVEKGKRSEVVEACEGKKVPVQFVAADELNRMTGSESHQSVVAHVKGRNFYDVERFLAKIEGKKRSLVLVLDQIFDPQNFGALLRSAECLGADAVLWSKNRGCDLTPVAAKASSGASELLSLIRISNLAEGVSQLQKGGFEAVAAVLDPRSEDAFSFSFALRTALIVGSEGEGIQPLIQKRADRLIYIPMSGKIDSLNVAQAASILLAIFRKNCAKG